MSLDKIKTKLETLHARITADTEAYNKLLGEAQQLEAVANVKAGDTVNFSTGKGEKAVLGRGLVLGVADGKVKVTSGEGFDTVITTIKLSDIQSVEAETAEAAIVPEAPAAE